MALERTNVVLQKKVLEMKRQGMKSIRKTVLSLRAYRKTGQQDMREMIKGCHQSSLGS